MSSQNSSSQGSITNPASSRIALWQRLSSSFPADLVVLAAAACTRFWRLEFHSFWFDEAVSLAWARADAADILRITLQLSRDKHPPAYYLALHYWQGLLEWFGAAESDAALRTLGVLMGLLMVWGIIRLATELSGRVTGLLAGLFVALAPFLVWYSQELRMFQPAATAIVWALFFMVDARRHDPSRGRPAALSRLLRWLGFAAALILSLYSYLYAAFFLPGLGLSLILLACRGGAVDRRYLLEGSTALAIVAALFLPLARNAWLVNSAENPPGAAFADFLPNLWLQLKIFTVWLASWSTGPKIAAVSFFAFLVAAGLTLPGKERRGPQFGDQPLARSLFQRLAAGDQVLLWLWIGGPLLIGNLLLAANAAIFREDRYFLFVAPFVLWGAARGVGAIGRRWTSAGICSGVVAVALLAAALPVLWTPWMFRENWRATAEYINAYRQSSPGFVTAAVIHPYFVLPALEWYLRRESTADELPIFGNFGDTLTPEKSDSIIAPHLQKISADLGADTVWLVQRHLVGVDDQRLVQAWMDANYPLITEQYPTGIHVRGYAVRHRYQELPELSDRTVFPNAQLFPGIELAACEIVTPVVAARDVIYHPPSGWVHVRFWLRAIKAIGEEPTIFALIQSDDGNVWGRSLERSGDVLAVYPPALWQPGELVRVELDVNLNPLTRPGSYNVKVEAAGEFGVPCGRVQIE